MGRTKKIPVASGPIRNPAYVGPPSTNLPHVPVSSIDTPTYPPGLSADPKQSLLTHYSGSSIAHPLGLSDICTTHTSIPSTFDPVYPPGPLTVDPAYPRGPLAFNSAYSSASSAVDLSYPGFSTVDPAYHPFTAQIAYPPGQSTVEQSHLFSGPHLATSSSVESSDLTVPSAPFNQHSNYLTIARNQFFQTLAAGVPQTNIPQRNTQVLTATSGFSTVSNGSMDKRHPSSFQQLEKLGEGTYATVSLVHSSKTVLIFLGFQRAKSTNRRACSAQGNPPRFRGRHPFHCYTRDIVDERA